MIKKIFFISIFALSLNAFDFKAYDIGGNESNSKTSIIIKAEEFALLPFSNLDIRKDEVNRDGDFTLIFVKVNDTQLEPIKIASNYKYEPIVIKVFKDKKIFDDSTFVTQSEEFLVDKDVIFISIKIQKG
jgi:hypothetical protein